MWSSSTILDIRDQATRKAKRQHKLPVKAQDFLNGTTIPFLGDYVPQGWVQDPNIEPFLVDATGRGDESEPATTQDALYKQARNFVLSGDVFAYGIREQGPFQVVVAVYRPDPRDFTHTGALTESELRKVAGKL